MEQVPRKGTKTDKNSESRQERDHGGEPPRHKSGMVGPCHVAQSCPPGCRSIARFYL